MCICCYMTTGLIRVFRPFSNFLDKLLWETGNSGTDLCTIFGGDFSLENLGAPLRSEGRTTVPQLKVSLTPHLTQIGLGIQDSEHVCTTVPQPTHQPPRQRTDTTLDGGAENAGVENAGVENAGVDSKGGKCRSGKCGSRQQRWKMQEWKMQEW